MRGITTTITGLFFGDEGKAKIIDYLLSGADGINYNWSARFNGSDNAGSTQEYDGLILVTHSTPAGIFNKQIGLYIGSGCVLNPFSIIKEAEEFESHGIPIYDRLVIDSRVSLTQPHHVFIDSKDTVIGTVGKGNGPAYTDRAARNMGGIQKNITIGNFITNPDYYIEEVRKSLSPYDCNLEKVLDDFYKSVDKIKDCVSLDPFFLDDRVESGDNVLLVGANASNLDCEYGQTPHVTSSRTLASIAYPGANLTRKSHHKNTGVIKAIPSKVGTGPLIGEYGGRESDTYCNSRSITKSSELASVNQEKLLNLDYFDLNKNGFQLGQLLRIWGGEYGATSGRPRRISILDLVNTKHHVRVNEIDELYITKIDALYDFSKLKGLRGIPVIVGYQLNDIKIDHVPTTLKETDSIKPIINFFRLIERPNTGCKDYDSLSPNTKSFIEFIEDFVGVKVVGLGTGPSRDDLIIKK